MLILNKSFESIQKKAEEQLIKNGINNTPGSIARLFLSIINTEQAEFYETLSTYHAQCFVSTARDEYLDEIGKLLDCKRRSGESDNDFRYRITKQCLTLSSANETAIRLAVLSVEGVEDVKLKSFTRGTGSFSVYILNEYQNVNKELIEKVVASVNEVVGFGIRFDVVTPELIEVELSIQLLFNNLTSQNMKDETKISVKREIVNYIKKLNIGDPIVLNELTQIIMQQNDDILNYSILEFKINYKDVMFENQYCEQIEKFVVSSKQNSIKVY